MKKKGIGLVLSGGGYRALVFQLGVLKYYAEKKLFSEIDIISSVSGGSLTPALIFKYSNMTWPTDEVFLKDIFPKIKEDINSVSMTRPLVTGRLSNIGNHLGNNGAKSFAKILEKHLGINGTLQDLPDRPRWIINATSLETGKNWRFEKKEMGDWITGVAKNPEIRISQAVAASCGLLIAIGTLKIRTEDYKWYRRKYSPKIGDNVSSPRVKKIHLWDGALYDNLGAESVFKPDTGFHNGVERVVVADASYSKYFYRSKIPLTKWRQLFDITLRASQNIRTRVFWKHMKKDFQNMSYIKIGKTPSEIQSEYNFSDSDVPKGSNFLSDERIMEVAAYPTGVNEIGGNDFDDLVLHGYQVASLSMIKFLK